MRCCWLRPQNQLVAWGVTPLLRANALHLPRCIYRTVTKPEEHCWSHLPGRWFPCVCSRKWRGRSAGWWSSGCGRPVSSAAWRTDLCPPASSPRSRSTAPGPPGREGTAGCNLALEWCLWIKTIPIHWARKWGRKKKKKKSCLTGTSKQKSPSLHTSVFSFYFFQDGSTADTSPRISSLQKRSGTLYPNKHKTLQVFYSDIFKAWERWAQGCCWLKVNYSLGFWGSDFT